MWGPGGVSCVIRFICHIPTGMMGITGLNTYRQLASLGDIYDVVPHGRAFLEGMSYIGYAGTATFAWNFFQFAASPFCRGNLLGLIGLVDLVLSGLLIAGVALAGMFLPDTYGPCNDASNWNNGTDGRNLFLVANATGNFGTNGPNGACQSVMLIWVMTIVVIIFYVICGFINLLLGCLAKPGSKTSFGSMPRYDIDLFPWLFMPARLLFKPVYLLYRFTRGSVHITVRYISKRLSRMNHINHPQKHEGSTHAVKPGLETHSFRLPMELVIMITKDLHHADLINIALSSKYLRTAFFGTNNPAQVGRDLRQFACIGGIPSTSCPVCRIQTCSGCRRNAPAPRHNLAFKHLTGCRATCTRCFFANHCFRTPEPARPGKRWTNGTGWADRTFRNSRGPSSGVGPSSYGGNRLGGRGFESALEEVCHNCARLPEEVREERRDAGNLREMWRQARLPMAACFTCKKVLPEGGVRWWMDPGTGGECKWYGHPAWVDGKGRRFAAGVEG